MKLLYVDEHFSCYNYEKKDRPAIEDISMAKQETWQINTVDNKILFVTKGSLIFAYGEYAGQTITEGKLMLVPSGCKFHAEALEDAEITVFRIRMRIQLCETFSLEKLKDEDLTGMPIPFYLDLDERLAGYLSALRGHIEDGMRCFYYFQLKLKELFFLLRAYYPKEELAAFFAPLLSGDLSFSEAIYHNYQNVRTVRELADKMNYSLSGFQKRFKKVFGVSAHNWIIEQRGREILSDINCSDKTLKDISDNYGFSSPSHFNDFCKSHFGDPPGRLRKKMKKEA